MSDPAIERLEAELRESRFKPWDVETFLANRHRAKIAALTDPQNKWAKRRALAQEMAVAVAAFVGYITIVAMAGLWLVTGEFPLL